MNFSSPLISASKLAAVIAAGTEIVVVDCRFELSDPDAGRKLYEGGHIPGAIYADLNKDLAGPLTPASGRHPLPNREEFVAKLGAWGIDQRTPVVVYDQVDGAYAGRLWWMLKWLGKPNVVLLDGGYRHWCQAGGAVSRSAPEPRRREFRAQPSIFSVFTTDELTASLNSDNPPILVDARAEPRFRGELEPIDTAAGHVPGARNWPFSRNSRPDGRWKTAAELRTIWTDATGAQEGDAWVAMCGSGVTACNLAVAAEIAGISPPRLYIGSWSEWIRDPDRPIVAGDE